MRNRQTIQEKFLKELASISMLADSEIKHIPRIIASAKVIFALCILCALGLGRTFEIFFIVAIIYFCLLMLNYQRIRKYFSGRVMILILVTAVLMVPATLNIFNKGQAIFAHFHLNNLEIYCTSEGLRWFLIFMCRFTLMILLANFLRYWIGWNDLITGLQQLHAPYIVIFLLVHAIKNIMSMLRTAENMYMARISRLFSKESMASHYSWSSSVIALLLKKSLQVAVESSYGMKSRYLGKAPVVAEFHYALNDVLWMLIAIIILVISIISMNV